MPWMALSQAPGGYSLDVVVQSVIYSASYGRSRSIRLSDQQRRTAYD